MKVDNKNYDLYEKLSQTFRSKTVALLNGGTSRHTLPKFHRAGGSIGASELQGS
jgi:hypothetical protein